MKTRVITVTSRVDPTIKRPAQVIMCNVCDGEDFKIYLIGDHSHLECVMCQSTFCEGLCDEEHSHAS